MNLLNSLLSSDRKRVWSDFAKSRNGVFVSRPLEPAFTLCKYKGWDVLLSTFQDYAPDGATGFTSLNTTDYTSIQIPYKCPDRFIFKVFFRNAFATLRKKFGMQDLHTGQPDFDDLNIVQSNMPDRMDLFLNKPLIRDFFFGVTNHLLKVKKPKLITRERIPRDTGFLWFQAEGMIADPRTMEAWFDFITMALDQLVEIGSASPNPSNYSLWEAKYF